MAKEIERKFLVKGDSWRGQGKSRLIRQGFFLTDDDRSVRVRILGEQAFLTLKASMSGFSRFEFEYEIPMHDAQELLDKLCGRPLVEKTRNWVEYGGRSWVVDEFHGENEGLFLAEVELDDESDTVERPEWCGKEVSDNPRFYNAYISRHPFMTWNLHPKSELGKEYAEAVAHRRMEENEAS
ncbi:MAG: CYTH domain-containing protein [Magnetococcales bacterium]|nr:CYTH domain-containing protein [Magnetococcales bacterium]